MRVLSSALLISGAATAVSAHRHHGSHLHLHHRQAAAGGSVIVSGANGLGDGQIHSRLEVSDMVANRPEQFNLLVLAMGEWQTQDKSNATSYYQVSTIHGVPRTSWDGVEACESCSSADGYCTHVSILFPAWHRAYLALFEQEFLKVVDGIANRFTGEDKTVYQKAASTMRLPYWDWAAKPDPNSNVLPDMLSQPTVTVDGPNGRQTIANPFYQYAIPDVESLYYAPFTVWPETFRYPNSNADSAASDDTSAINAFNNIQPNMQTSVYQLLTNCKDYDHFSHDGATGSTSCANSLEGIHNTIHTTAGGPGAGAVSGGHMTYLPLASYDPLFWIHHANVDRIFALWQTLNPDSYGGSQVAVHNTWTIATGSTQDSDSPLTPFRKDANSFWTTNLVHDFENTFKYTYPEFASTDGSAKAVAQIVNALYGSNPTLTASSVSDSVEKDAAGPQLGDEASVTSKRALLPTKAPSLSVGLSLGLNGGISAGLSIGLNSPVSAGLSTGLGGIRGYNSTVSAPYPIATGTSPSSPYTDSNGGQHEYSCNVRTPRFAYDVSYTVYVFTGEPSTEDTSKWLADDNCVGTFGVLAGGNMHADVTSQGSVSLTKHLQGKVQEGCLASMNPSDVTPYLQQYLTWKIVKQGEDIHPDDLPGYKAGVYSGVSTQHGSDSLPQWSAWQPQVEATHGKPGGIQSEEEAHSEWPANVGGDYGYGTPPATTSNCETSTVPYSAPYSTPTSAAPSYPAPSSPVESYPAPSYPAESYPAPSSPAESYPAPSSPAESYPASTPVESSPVVSYPSPPGYAPAPYPTESAPAPYNPVGTAAPSGTGAYYPSSSSITPYTGAGAHLSGNSLLGLAICALAGMLLL